jgi:hypothetical protein
MQRNGKGTNCEGAAGEQADSEWGPRVPPDFAMRRASLAIRSLIFAVGAAFTGYAGKQFTILNFVRFKS